MIYLGTLVLGVIVAALLAALSLARRDIGMLDAENLRLRKELDIKLTEPEDIGGG